MIAAVKGNADRFVILAGADDGRGGICGAGTSTGAYSADAGEVVGVSF